MFLLEHICTISRLQAVGTNGRKTQQQIATGVACLIVPMTPRAAVDNGYSPGKAYNGYFDEATSVQVGDQITCNTKTFTVSGIADYNVAFVGHQKVALTEGTTS